MTLAIILLYVVVIAGGSIVVAALVGRVEQLTAKIRHLESGVPDAAAWRLSPESEVPGATAEDVRRLECDIADLVAGLADRLNRQGVALGHVTARLDEAATELAAHKTAAVLAGAEKLARLDDLDAALCRADDRIKALESRAVPPADLLALADELGAVADLCHKIAGLSGPVADPGRVATAAVPTLEDDGQTERGDIDP